MKSKSKSKSNINNTEILLIKLYYTVISILLGEASYNQLEEYIIKIKNEIQVKQINVINVLNALRNVGIFKLIFFLVDIDNLRELIQDTINVLKLKTNKKTLQNLSKELTIRYIFLKIFSVIGKYNTPQLT
jgi:hypothetical protein